MDQQETAILQAIKAAGGKTGSKADWTAQRDRLMIKLLFADPTLRICEILALTVSDVDPELGLKVRRWPSGIEENIQVPTSLGLELGRWVAEERPPCDHLGLWPRFKHRGKQPGEPLAQDGFNLMLRKRYKDAGFSAVPRRIFRHATAVALSELGPLGAHLDAFLLSKRNAQRAARTVNWYERHIRHWIRWLISTGNLANWLEADTLDVYIAAERGRGLADRSIKSRFDCLRAFLRWLRRRKRITMDSDDLPTAICDPPRVKTRKPRQADYGDLQKLINSIGEEDWIDLRDRCILTLLLCCGLRVDEACNVQVQDVNLAEGFVFVAHGKGDKARVVPFGGEFRLAYVSWIYNRPATAEAKLFLCSDRWKHPKEQTFSGQTVRFMLQRRCAEVGVNYINPHSVRHLYAIKSLNNGVSLSAVSCMMGHESVSFTGRLYAKWVQAGLRREYDSNWVPMPPRRPQPLATVPQPA